MTSNKILRARQLAKPSYFGGKQSLTGWIFQCLSEHIPIQYWPNLTFLDAFLGGGAMSLAAKSSGFQQLIVNDCSDRSHLIAQAFLLNSTFKLTRLDLLYLNQALPDEVPRVLENTYSPSVFSTRHAQRLEQWLYWAGLIQEPVRKALYLILIWHCINAFRCFPTSRGTSNRPYAEALDGLRGWDTLNPKRFEDGTVDRLLKPTLEIMQSRMESINQGIFSGSPVIAYQEDALSFLPQVNGDIVYLDPPYAGTQRYDEGFALVDTLLFPTSHPFPATDFSSRVDALHALLESASHIPTWVLSYGGPEIDLDTLTALVQHHAGTRQVIGYAKAYSHMRHVARRKNNQELLVIASERRGLGR